MIFTDYIIFIRIVKVLPQKKKSLIIALKPHAEIRLK